MSAYETFEVNGYTVKLHQDTEMGTGNPRDQDNLGVMLANGHRNYVLGDAEFSKHIPEYDRATAILDDILNEEGFRRGQIEFETVVRRFKDELGATVVLPLWLLDHSGLAMRTTTFFEDPGNWDSGVVGFIFDTPRTREMLGTPPDRIQEVLQEEVKYYDMYLQGDVWGYEIEDPNGEHVGSCWGFLGFDYCKKEARSAAEQESAPLREEDLSEEQLTALAEITRERAGQIASNVVNEGKAIEYLVTNGMTTREIRERIEPVSTEPSATDTQSLTEGAPE
jgi:hypothetical protein